MHVAKVNQHILQWDLIYKATQDIVLFAYNKRYFTHYKREYKHIYLNVGVSIKWKAVALFHIPKTRLIPLYHSCRHSKCGNESVE